MTIHRLILSLLSIVAPWLTLGATPISFTFSDHRVEVQFYTPSVVRIVKIPTGHTFSKHSMVVIAQPGNVEVHRSGNTITSAELRVTVDARTGDVTFADRSGRRLLQECGHRFTPRTAGADQGAFKVGQIFRLDKNEAIYGLGTIQDGRLNRRGTHIYMEQSNLQDFQNVIQSVKGWGVYWDNYSPTQFDDDDQGMRLTSEVGTGTDYYFMYGGTTDGVISCMRSLTGHVPMFPLWTFGYWQSRERYKSSTELLDVVDKYRALQVPLDGIIQDWQYWGSNYNWNAMEFLAPSFADGARMVQQVHEKNAHLMISIWASFGPMTKAYAALNEKNLLFDFQTWPQSGIDAWPPRMDYPSGVRVYDAFSAEAREIYWQNLKWLYDLGIDAWWMDSTDPDCFNPSEADYDHKAGDGTWRSLRNAFPLATVGGVYDSQRREGNDKRVFIMTRSAFAGQQRYGSNMWSGDVASSWDMLRKQVPAGLNFSLTGNPNFNTDIGGFFCGIYNTQGGGSAPRNPQYQELYVRWMQYALFCPVFRSHGADAPREIYQFGSKGQPVYDAIEQTIRLRYRLLPYLYATAWQVTHADASYLRPLIADFSADRRVWDLADEFMLGPSILAAPIVEAQYTREAVIREDAMTGWDHKDTAVGGDTSKVDFTALHQARKYLPAGASWYDFWTGRYYRGGQYVTLTTCLNRVPMFVRAGSILPLAPVVQYVGERPWNELELRVYPGADADFTLYEDEGDNYNYEQGAYSTIHFHWDDATRTLVAGARQGSYPGMLTRRMFTVLLPDGTRQEMAYDGSAAKVSF